MSRRRLYSPGHKLKLGDECGLWLGRISLPTTLCSGLINLRVELPRHSSRNEYTLMVIGIRWCLQWGC